MILKTGFIYGLSYKSFTIIIYYRNDKGLYYNTMIVANLITIVANLALARSVNYDRKVRCKLKCTFTILNLSLHRPLVVASFTIIILLTLEASFTIVICLEYKTLGLYSQHNFNSSKMWYHQRIQ